VPPADLSSVLHQLRQPLSELAQDMAFEFVVDSHFYPFDSLSKFAHNCQPLASPRDALYEAGLNVTGD
jgi:hypothetical protein